MTRIWVGLALLAISGSAGAAALPPPAAAKDACPVSTALPSPPRDRSHETLRIRVMPGLAAAHGSMTVSFAPAVATSRLVFRLWPNSPFYVQRGARLTVGSVTSGGRRLRTVRPDPTTLVIRRRVAARELVTVSLDWALLLPRTPGLQLHGGRSARLVSFFPQLARNGRGWALDPPVPADSFWPTSPTADFDAHITVPKGVQVLATGESLGGGRWRARSVRDFALAVGRFRLATATVAAPRPVRLTVGLERGSRYPIDHFLDAAERALRSYAKRYGDYPWSTYSLAVMRDPR